MKTPRPLKLTKANVGRVLTAAGETKAVWHKSSRVRGWGRWSAGFQVEDVWSDKAVLHVRYITERHDEATESRLLDQWRIILAHRFHVRRITCKRDGELLAVRELTWEDAQIDTSPATPDEEAWAARLVREGR